MEQIFTVEIGILDSNNMLSQENDTIITLSLDSGNLNGTTSVSVQSGIATFSDLSIPTAGTYLISASSENFTTVTYPSSLVVSIYPLVRLDLSVPVNLTAYFEFEFEVSLTNEIEGVYLEETELKLESNFTLIGVTSVKAVNGKGVFKLYTKSVGPVEFTVSSGNISTAFEHFVNSPVTKLTASSDLTQISNRFNLTIQVYDSDEANLLTLTDLDFTVTLDPTGETWGTNSVKVVSGEGQLIDLVIISPGTFAFLAIGTVDGQELTSGSSESFVISTDQANLPAEYHDLKKLEIEFSQATPTAYFLFNVYVHLKNQIGKRFNKVCEVGLVGNTTLYGTTYHDTSLGLASFEVFSKSAGGVSLILTACEVLSKTVNITVLPLKAKIEVDDYIRTDSNYFNIKVGVYDNALEVQESKHGIYDISISLDPEGEISGQNNVSLVNGEWTFNKLSILEDGYFKFKANITEGEEGFFITTVESSAYLITEENANVPSDMLMISQIDIEVNETVTVFQDLKVEIEIFDQQGSTWEEECNIVINSNMTVYGETSKIVHKGEAEFSVYFKETGSAKVTILTCDGLTKSFNIEVLPYTQKVTLTPHVAEDSNYFDLFVEVLDYTGGEVLDTYGKFNVSISLVPEGNLTSNTKGFTKKGSRFFSPITILTPGDYQFAVSIFEQSGLEPETNPLILNETFQITAENAFIPKNMLILSYIEASVNTSVITTFFPFELTVKLFDQVNSTWKSNCLVNLSSDQTIFGETSKESDSGEVTFEIFFKYNGKFKLNILTETGLQSEIQLQVHRERLQVEPTFKFFPTSHYVNVNVEVLDNSKTEVESRNGEYEVTIFTIPDSEIHGNTTQVCQLGVCSFTGISILNNGSFRIGANVAEKSIGFETAPEGFSESVFTISEEIAHIYLDKIELFHNREVTEYVADSLNVILLDVNGALYNESIEVNIEASEEYSGQSSLLVEEGNSTVRFFYRSVGEDSIVVSTEHKSQTSSIRIVERMNYPLLTLIVLVWAMIVLIVSFTINDFKYNLAEFADSGLKAYCPILVFNNPGVNNRRVVTTARVFSSQLILFTVIGYLYNNNYIDSVNPEEGLDSFGFADWYIGFWVLLSVQVYTISLAFMHYSHYDNIFFANILKYTCYLVIVFCLISASFIVFSYNSRFYLFWVINYAIYGCIEFLLLHSCYGAVYYCLFHKPEPVENPMVAQPAVTEKLVINRSSYQPGPPRQLELNKRFSQVIMN